MRQVYVFCIAIFLICNFSQAQNVYENYSENDTLRGERLWLGLNNLSFSRTVSQSSYLEMNLNGSYSKWKFTPKNLYFLQAQLYNSYEKISSDDASFGNGRRNYLLGILYGGFSHYLKPKGLYGNISTKLDFQNNNGDFEENQSYGNGYLFGALGYGKISNAQGLEAAEYFSEALLKTKVINKPLDNATLLAIDKIIYSYRNGNYGNDYKDDAEIYLMKDIEKTLMQNNVISGKLDAESTMRLFTIFTNRSLKYYFYPRYLGFQTQGEIQYHLFSDIKPKENFAKISTAYGLPISKSSNLLLNGFYARALNDDAGIYLQNFPSYYFLPYGESDINNFNFTNNNVGYGNFYNSVIAANRSIIGIDAFLTQSLSSTAGIFFRNSYYYYPKSNSATVLNSESKFLFFSSLSLDYNIYSKLFASINLSYYKNETQPQESYQAGIRLAYTIF